MAPPSSWSSPLVLWPGGYPGESLIGSSRLLSSEHLRFRVFGGALITLGIIGLLDSFSRFAFHGLGTPAPVFPTRRLVATGLYRYVRNPMYVAVVITILGQGVFFGSWPLLEYGGLVWVLFHIFVLVYEEPTLSASFGSEYKSFCAEVPRWISRLTPWKSHSEVSEDSQE